MIQPVISLVPRQAEAVARLVKHCRALDGTEVKVIAVDDSKFTPAHPHNELACRSAWSLRTAALEMKGRPFMWLEPDSYPIKKGWLALLEAEYELEKKPFMLPFIADTKCDFASGIGIYPGDTHFLVPTQLSHHGWDMFVYRQLTPLVHFTRQVFHSYGTYFPYDHPKKGHVLRYHRFPRDNHIIPKEAVVVHKDGRGTLALGYENVFAHNGDLGDLCAALPAMRQLGGGHLIIGDVEVKEQKLRESLKGKRFEAIKPLLAAQPYIKSVTWGEMPKDPDFNFCTFRKDYIHRENLSRWQARHCGIDNLDESKWIDVAPSPESRGRVVIARSPRYHGLSFPWNRVIQEYRNKLLFVGLPEEHAAFEKHVGARIEYKPTENMLYLAKIIAGADLFIGNQSSPSWVAMGLAQNLIQEVWPIHPNSMVQRPNARFVFRSEDY